MPLSSILVLCLCVALLLPSSLALPFGKRASSSSRTRHSPPSLNAIPASSPTDPPPFISEDDSTQSDLSPKSTLYHNPPVAVHTDGTVPASEPIDSSPTFVAGARAVDDVDHSGHAPVQPPPRIRGQSQAGGLYSQQKLASRLQPKHVHSASEEVPLDEGDAANAQQQQEPSQPTASAADCLTAQQLTEAKKEVRARLLGVMDQYLAVWQAEEKSDDEIEQLYNNKKDELKLKLAAKRQELTARACPGAVTDSSENGHRGRRRLLGLEDDDWFDQEEEKVFLIDETTTVDDSVAAMSGNDNGVGVVARIVAGGAKAEPAEEDDGPHFDASIHPYATPSAFTSPTERDIKAIHSPAPVTLPTPRHQSVSPAATQHDDDNSGIGFIASISPPPRRYSPAPLDAAPSIVVVGQRSQRDMDDDLEDERRRRRERLKAIRSRSSNGAVDSTYDPSDQSLSVLSAGGSLPLTDDELPPGGFIASISPMAPQRHSVDSVEYDNDVEGGGGVWRSGSRGRLGRVVGRGGGEQ